MGSTKLKDCEVDLVKEEVVVDKAQNTAHTRALALARNQDYNDIKE